MIVFFLIGYDIVECLELLKVCNEQLMEVWLFFTHFYLTDCVQQPSPGWQRIADCRASGINHKKVNEDCKNINICLAAEFQLEREFCKENVLALICAQQSINQILVVCPSSRLLTNTGQQIDWLNLAGENPEWFAILYILQKEETGIPSLNNVKRQWTIRLKALNLLSNYICSWCKWS